MLVLGPSNSSPVVVMNSTGSAGASNATSASSNSTSPTITNRSTSRPNVRPQMQRNRSKGTIVAYGSSMSNITSESSSSEAKKKSEPSQSTATSNNNTTSNAAVSTSSTNPPALSATDQTVSCPAARLVLLCAQNALRLGARTQLLLCPPGPRRRDLQAALRQAPRRPSLATMLTTSTGSPAATAAGNNSRRQSLPSNMTTANSDNGYYGLDKLVGADTLADYEAQEEAFLLQSNSNSNSNNNTTTNKNNDNSMNVSSGGPDSDDDEDASSGDDDELLPLVALLSMEPLELDDGYHGQHHLSHSQQQQQQQQEPLYSLSSVSSHDGATNIYGNHHHHRNTTTAAPYACSKLPFGRRKLRFFDMASPQERTTARQYLQREFTRSKLRATLLLTKRLRHEQLEAKRQLLLEQQQHQGDIGATSSSNSALIILEALVAESDKKIASSIEPFPAPMTPSMAAALLLESLVLNPLESVEGMSKCYDGIVAVGVALLDLQQQQQQNAILNDATASLIEASSSSNKHRPLRSEIMAALAPLLITSLEQPSGEVILQLAKLRRMAGTVRYQRRFVQRVAPLLIRPPRGAMYCVRHQNDMEAILAATELILDSAFDVFGKGWYERGRLLLVDKKRAKTLQSAAQQLRDLVNVADQPTDGLVRGLSGYTTTGGRRRSLTAAASDNMLAEWEVIAVDRQIRASIGSVLSMDWSRAILHSDIPKPHNRRATVANGATKRVMFVPQASALDSAKFVPSSPRSPQRMAGNGTSSTPPSSAASPHSTTVTPEAAAEEIVSPKALAHRAGRSLSPPSQRLPLSPPPLQRANSHDEGKMPMTPPRSPNVTPKSPTRNADSAALAPLSPKRGRTLSTPTFSGLPAAPSFTPTSPSASSVGSDANLAANTALNAYVAGTPTQRTLTSSTAERKRTVAACRALRAQIQRFEEAFIQLHGRPPKGQQERAPLATTYAQYKEWKRAIRTDAACRVQAFFRGAYVRWKLLRKKDPKITRVVMKRAGCLKPSENSNIMSQISLPVEIGQLEQERGANFPIPRAGSAADSNVPPGQNLPWASKIVRRRSAGDRGDVMPTSGVPRPFPSPPSEPVRPSSVTSNSSMSDFDGLDLSGLQARKRDLKQQLKQYDMNFARRHGRMPVKAEKEPIRHLYEAYNSLKSRITDLETDGVHQGDVAMAPLSPLQVSPTPPAPFLPQRLSPTSGSEHSGSDESVASRAASIPTPRSRRKLPVAGSPPMAARSQPSSSSSPAVQDLASLKAEKSQLHQMLRSYEKDFFREHNRQVSSYADIQPVANQYRRYKDIKKAIAALQGQQGDGSNR